jgi:hypothetical protein
MAMPPKFAKPADLPPQLALFQMITGHYLSRAIYVAAKLGIADLLSGGAQHYQELAKATRTHAPSLNRLMRLLSSAGVFAEQENGRFALTPVGEWLQSALPGSRRAGALLFAGPAMHRAWDDLLYSVETGNVAFDHAFGMGAFDYMAQHPEEAAIFNQAMVGGTTQTAAAVADAYDFTPFGTIVDVGGGHGALLIAILKANPKLRGALFELPHVTEGARKAIEAAGLASRCEVVAGDFFQAVPEGGDAYILKSVIHDWDDTRSATILRHCHRVMAPQAKLLLVEVAMPDRVDPSPAAQIIAGSDVNMLVNVGGRERTEAEFRALFDTAGFKLNRIIPTETLPSVLEGVRV